jgi:hypothetical protein
MLLQNTAKGRMEAYWSLFTIRPAISLLSLFMPLPAADWEVNDENYL